MTKLKFFKIFDIFEILLKFYIKVLKNRLILNKNFPSGPQVEGALWDSRPPASLEHLFFCLCIRWWIRQKRWWVSLSVVWSVCLSVCLLSGCCLSIGRSRWLGVLLRLRGTISDTSQRLGFFLRRMLDIFF